ncbi:MAG: hypothetical protein VKJ04_00435 [Vampirovibrionales bacterium]|nr:hypothetical protein [Vampirovibrionales bacterium]
MVELVLVLIVLLPILMGVGYVGLAMYQGTIASEAIKEPATLKSELASRSGSISAADIMAQAQSGGKGGILQNTAALDSVEVSAPINDDTVLLIGRKKSITIPLFNISFDFGVVQPVQKSLLQANVGTPSSSPNQAPPNLNGTAGPPWENPAFEGMPSRIECTNGGITINQSLADTLYANAPTNTYESRVTFSQQVMLGVDTVLGFARDPQVVAACQNAGNTCAQEQANLMPKDPTDVSTVCPVGSTASKCIRARFYENPKGAPGQQLEIFIEDDQAPVLTYSEKYPAPHGLYHATDYTQPPADFVSSCQQRKQAECAIQKAAEKANALYESIKSNCED